VRERYPREPFELRRAIDLLQHPFGGRDLVTFTHWTKPDGRHHTVYIPYSVLYEFEEIDGDWSFVSEGHLMSIH
jgi:hypothetical protein